MAKATSIIILTQYYLPEIGAPQRRLSELAERMVRAGYQVTVLTAMPNYPLGKIQAGYGGFFMKEERDGVQILRSFIYPTQKATIFHRLLNYFSFVFSSILIGSFMLPKSKFLLVESPPLFLSISAFWLAWLKRSRLIFNVSDLWPESAVRLNIVREGSIPHRLSAQLESLAYRSAWLVTGQSRSILSDIEARFPKTKTFLLSNGADVNKFAMQSMNPAIRQKITPKEGMIILLYAGLHGLAQGLSQIIEAADKLSNHSELLFVLVGDGPEKADLIANAQSRALNNILFLDPLPSEEIPPLLAAADILLITLKSYIPGAVPSKLYESMATGKPVIMVATGEPADIVREHQVGLTVEPSQIDELVKAILKLAEQADLREKLGENGRHAVEEYFNRDKIVSRFIDYLNREI